MSDTSENAAPWSKVTASVDEYADEARANLDAMEAKAIAQVREIFVAQRERLESDLVRMASDLAIQRAQRMR